MGKFTKIIVGITLIIHICSCTDTYTICDANTLVFERSGFYHISAGIEQVAYPPSFTLQTPGSAYPIYFNVGHISKFTLPLNPLLDSNKYQLFVYPNSTPDTLTFVYTSQPFSIDPDCGKIYIHNLTRVSVTKHHIDSVIISNRTINNVSGENLKIYF